MKQGVRDELLFTIWAIPYIFFYTLPEITRMIASIIWGFGAVNLDAKRRSYLRFDHMTSQLQLTSISYGPRNDLIMTHYEDVARVYDKNLNFKFKLGEGSVISAAIGPRGNFLIANREGIQSYDAKGRLVTHPRITLCPTFGGPHVIRMVLWNNQIVIAERNTLTIQVYESDGRFVRQFTPVLTFDEKFEFGHDLLDFDISIDGILVAVCDQQSHAFDIESQRYLFTLPIPQYSIPQSVRIDTHGNIVIWAYVTKWDRTILSAEVEKAILIYNSQGKLIKIISCVLMHHGSGNIMRHRGLAIDNMGRIVTEENNVFRQYY